MAAPPLDMLCTPDNAREFNAALRQHAPDLHALARELHHRGMIDGLRGARLMDPATAAQRRAATAAWRIVPEPSTQYLDRRRAEDHRGAGRRHG